MVSGTRDNPPPPPRDNFTERLYGVVVLSSTPVSLGTATIRPGSALLHIGQNGGVKERICNQYCVFTCKSDRSIVHGW